MRFLITSLNQTFREVNLEDLEKEIRDGGLRVMSQAIDLILSENHLNFS